MAIDTIKAYSHLTDDDIAEIGRRLDEIKDRVTSDLGESDVAYIKNLIRTQRMLEFSGRLLVTLSTNKGIVAVGTSALGLAKILENLEIGHNVSHGQWDWMNDPEIHSTTWEWDNTCPSAQWQHSHNFVHHTYTNILGMDNDVGYGILRVTRDRKWVPMHAFQPLINFVLATLFQWAVAFYDVNLGRYFQGKQTWAETSPAFMEVAKKAGKQSLRDYLFNPVIAALLHPSKAKKRSSLPQQPI